MTKRTQVKMYNEMVEIFLHFVGVIPVFLIAVIGRTMERYASERVETRTNGACEWTTWQLGIRLSGILGRKDTYVGIPLEESKH